jgi:hypothetical protein
MNRILKNELNPVKICNSFSLESIGGVYNKTRSQTRYTVINKVSTILKWQIRFGITDQILENIENS